MLCRHTCKEENYMKFCKDCKHYRYSYKYMNAECTWPIRNDPKPAPRYDLVTGKKLPHSDNLPYCMWERNTMSETCGVEGKNWEKRKGWFK